MPGCETFQTDSGVITAGGMLTIPRLAEKVTFESIDQWSGGAEVLLKGFHPTSATDDQFTINEGETVTLTIDPPKPTQKARFEEVSDGFNGWKECKVCIHRTLSTASLGLAFQSGRRVRSPP